MEIFCGLGRFPWTGTRSFHATLASTGWPRMAIEAAEEDFEACHLVEIVCGLFMLVCTKPRLKAVSVYVCV